MIFMQIKKLTYNTIISVVQMLICWFLAHLKKVHFTLEFDLKIQPNYWNIENQSDRCVLSLSGSIGKCHGDWKSGTLSRKPLSTILELDPRVINGHRKHFSQGSSELSNSLWQDLWECEESFWWGGWNIVSISFLSRKGLD